MIVLLYLLVWWSVGAPTVVAPNVWFWLLLVVLGVCALRWRRHRRDLRYFQARRRGWFR